jgi:hypothetical protein
MLYSKKVGVWKGKASSVSLKIHPAAACCWYWIVHSWYWREREMEEKKERERGMTYISSVLMRSQTKDNREAAKRRPS